MTTGQTHQQQPCTYALIRTDKSENRTAADSERIRDLAEGLGFELRGILAADSDDSFAALFAGFELSGITALLVPSVLHITGWMNVVRQHVDVWTLDPPGRWPRHSAPGVRTAFLPGPGGE